MVWISSFSEAFSGNVVVERAGSFGTWDSDSAESLVAAFSFVLVSPV